MSRNNSLKYELKKSLLPTIKNNNTQRSYKRAINSFVEWAKENSVAHLKDVTTDVIQAYTTALEADPKEYSPSIIHAKIAPICKAAGINMDRIRKPKRTADRIIRGRNPDVNTQGQRELTDPKYNRCIKLQTAIGIRRAELARLTGEDFDGIWLTVQKGKGGKRTRQWILPQDRGTVSSIFRNVKPSNRVLSKSEIPTHANLHRLRAEHAQRCYDYFNRACEDPEYATKLKSSLVKEFDHDNTRLWEQDPGRYMARRNRFITDLNGIYKLRGKNRQKAEELGLPTEYRKLALMAVSVYELAHWRLDVTVVNYLIQ